LDKVVKLRGVYFDWNEDETNFVFNDGKQIGVIAQEVEEIFPELVKTDENGYKMVDYTKITPVLIEALKEQNSKIVSLENDNADLKLRLEKLESIVNLLTADNN
jgi:hypothetical protein